MTEPAKKSQASSNAEVNAETIIAARELTSKIIKAADEAEDVARKFQVVYQGIVDAYRGQR